MLERVMWCLLGLFAGANIGLLLFALININKRQEDEQQG